MIVKIILNWKFH